MADINLTQAEADALIAIEKKRADDSDYFFPPPGGRIAIPLASPDKRESFMLDVTRAQIKLTKATTKIGPGRRWFSCDWIWTGHLIATPMIRKFPAPTCTRTVKATGTNGRCLPLSKGIQIPPTSSRRLRLLCNIATSQILLISIGDCSHDHG
jgi:hypothetical protein